MDNQNIWQGRVKIVAIVELFLSSLSLLMIVFILTWFISVTAASNKKVDEETTQVLPPENRLALYVLEPSRRRWIASAYRIILLFAAIKLFKSTNPECSGPDAIRMAKIWMAINLVFILLGVLCEIVKGRSESEIIIFFVIRWIIRGVEIFIVYQFLGELEGRTSSLQGLEWH